MRMSNQDYSPFNDKLPATQPVGSTGVGPIPETTAGGASTSKTASATGAQGEFSPFNDKLPHTQAVGSKGVGPIPETTNPSGSVGSGGVTSSSTTKTTQVSSTGAAATPASAASASTTELRASSSGQAKDSLQKAVGQQLQSQGADVVYDDGSVDISAAQQTEIVREAPLVKERIHEETTGTHTHTTHSNRKCALSCVLSHVYHVTLLLTFCILFL